MTDAGRAGIRPTSSTDATRAAAAHLGGIPAVGTVRSRSRTDYWGGDWLAWNWLPCNALTFAPGSPPMSPAGSAWLSGPLWKCTSRNARSANENCGDYGSRASLVGPWRGLTWCGRGPATRPWPPV